MLASFGVEAVLRDVILPALEQVGDDWQRGSIDISQEHFVQQPPSGGDYSRSRGSGAGGRAARAPRMRSRRAARHHASRVRKLVLRSHGWRILYLGADTPIETVARTAKTTVPSLAVVSAFDAGLLDAHVAALRRLARTTTLVLAGPGASDTLCTRIGVRRLYGDLVTAANEIAARA